MTQAKNKPSNKDQVLHKAKDYLRQGWLASLGAYAQIQQRGYEVFQKLVKEGEKFNQDIEKRVEKARKTASERRKKANHSVQSTISTVLQRLGLSTNDDVQKLSRRVDTLSNNLKKLNA